MDNNPEHAAAQPARQAGTAHDVDVAPGASLGTQLFRFIAVGVGSAVIDFGLTLILTHLGLHRSLAKAIGWVFGTITAYVLNARWTFGAQVGGKTAGAVAGLYLATFAVQNFLYWVLESPLQAMGFTGTIKDTIAFVIAQGVATVTNFVIQRMFIFK